MTTEEFAAKEGVSERALGWWRWHLRVKPPEDGPAPKPKKATTRAVSPVTFIEMPSAVGAELFEVVLSTGIRIRVPADFDPSALKRLLEVFESPT